SPIKGDARALDEFGAHAVEFLPDSFRLICVHGWPSDRLIEQSRSGQRHVPNFLGRKPLARASRQEAIAGVELVEPCSARRILTVCRGENELLEQRLHVPTGVHKLPSEVVEKTRMGWLGSLNAEVLAGFHNADSEQHLPKTVHGNS